MPVASKNEVFTNLQKCFCQKTEKFLLRCEIDRKIRTLNSRFFSKILGITEKGSSHNSVEKLLPEDDNFFCSMSKNVWKKENFFSTNCFHQIVFTDIKRAVFTTSSANFQRQAEFFSLKVRKIQKKRFKLNNASKSFYGHVASIFDEPV